MAKSNYGQIKKYENEILAMKEAGYTKHRIAEELALTKEQIKEFLKRHRRRERKIDVCHYTLDMHRLNFLHALHGGR